MIFGVAIPGLFKIYGLKKKGIKTYATIIDNIIYRNGESPTTMGLDYVITSGRDNRGCKTVYTLTYKFNDRLGKQHTKKVQIPYHTMHAKHKIGGNIEIIYNPEFPEQSDIVELLSTRVKTMLLFLVVPTVILSILANGYIEGKLHL